MSLREKISNLSSTLSTIELRMTKEADGIRHKLTQQAYSEIHHGDQRREVAIPPRVAAIRAKRMKVEAEVSQVADAAQREEEPPMSFQEVQRMKAEYQAKIFELQRDLAKAVGVPSGEMDGESASF